MNRSRATTWTVAALLAGVLAARAQTDRRDSETAFRDAAALAKDAGRYGEAVAAFQELADSPKTPAKTRERALQALVDVHARKGERQKAIDAAEAWRRACPKNADVDRQAVFAQADQYWAWTANSNPAPAVAVLNAFVERRAKDGEACGQAHLRAARLLARALSVEAAERAAAAAMAADPENAGLALDALWALQELAARTRRPEARLKALAESLAPKYREALQENGLAARRDLYAATLREVKRYDELRRFLAELEQSDATATRRQQACLAAADSYREEGKLGEALAGYERVFTAHAGDRTAWADAQARLVDTLCDLKRYGDALKAARVQYDAARDRVAVDRAVQRMAEILRLADEKPDRAEAFLAMQRYGAAGRDGKPGSADDPRAVLPEIGYPDSTARRRACDAAAAAAGDGTDASLQRGWGCLYAADPRAALLHFAEALRRCPVAQVGAVAGTVAMNGFRPLRAQGADLDDVSNFIAWGPAGVDAKPGTDDDLADPFAALGLSGSSPQPGGVVPLAPAETKPLADLARELRELVAHSENASRQLAAVAAYQRIVEAWVVLDRAETLGWIRGVMRAETDGRVLGALARLGQSVAKANQLHVAEARQYDAGLAAEFETAGRAVPADVQSASRHLEGALRSLEKKSLWRRR